MVLLSEGAVDSEYVAGCELVQARAGGNVDVLRYACAGEWPTLEDKHLEDVNLEIG